MFTLLLAVSGVGPKLALNILSNIPADELQSALAAGNVTQLNSVPGIGRKTAERLILELQEKVRKTFAAEIASRPETAAPSSEALLEDALSALINLGYKEQLARKALSAQDLAEATSVEKILKGALRILVK
jgi:Holliday junction DNA helicase RuvA